MTGVELSDKSSYSKITWWNLKHHQSHNEISRDICWFTGNQEVKSCRLVFLRCVTNQTVHVQSTWLTLGEAVFAKNEVFESSSRARTVSFPQMPQGRTHYEINYTEGYLIDFHSLCLLHPRTTTQAYSSTLPDNKQGHVYWGWKISVSSPLSNKCSVIPCIHFKLPTTSSRQIFVCWDW